MAPTTRVGFAVPYKGPPPRLSVVQYALCALGAPAMLAMFIVGIAGLSVMMGEWQALTNGHIGWLQMHHALSGMPGE
jgi:hypothetical protein